MYIVGFFYIIGYDARYKQCQIQNIHVLLLMKALRVYMCLRMDIFLWLVLIHLKKETGSQKMSGVI